MLRHSCTSNFLENHPKAIIIQTSPFGLAIDISSGKGVAATSNNVYHFKLCSVVVENGDESIEWGTADMRLFLKTVLPTLTCYAIGTKKTKNNPWTVKMFLSHHPICNNSYEIQGEIKK
jgi:hypothetical protein